MKATRPSRTADRTLYWRRPAEEIDVIELERKARAANIPALRERAKAEVELNPKD